MCGRISKGVPVDPNPDELGRAIIPVGNGPIAFGNFISTHVVGIPSYGNEAASVSIDPNPATSQLTIPTSIKVPATISIKNALGQDVSTPLNVRRPLSEVEVDVSNLAAGIYFLQLKTENGSMVRKFVKE